MKEPRIREDLLLRVAALVVLVGVLLAYFQGLPGAFIFDDPGALTHNAYVQIDGSVFDEWRTASLSSHSGPLRRPVAMFSFAANHAVFGEFTPTNTKLINILIHLICGYLVFVLSRELLSAIVPSDAANFEVRFAAFAAAALWLLHPLHVSTVIYAVQRMAQLATLFTLLGLVVFCRYRSRWSVQGGSAGEIMAAALWLSLICLFGVLSKENGILLLWLIPVLEICVYRGLWCGARVALLDRLGWLLFLLPLGFIGAIFLLSPETILAGFERREFSITERLMTQSRLLWQYLSWIVIPDLTSLGFQHDDIPLSASVFQPITTLLSIVSWCAALSAGFLLRERYPLLLFALLFYLVAHSMESSFIALEMVYEHRNYLPSVAICMLLTSFLVPLVRSKQVKKAVLATVVIATVLFSVLSIRAHWWSDYLMLSRVNLDHHPQSARSNYFYAEALMRRHEQREALGLSEQEGRDVLLASRHYYERMHQQNPRDVAALVILYHLDTLYFPDMLEIVDWLAVLEEVLLDKTLLVSDRAALSSFVSCLAARICPATLERISLIFDNLLGRFPGNARLLMTKYQYFEAMGASASERRAILDEAAESSPWQKNVYRYQIMDYARSNEIAAMYESARQWLYNDPNRHDLADIKRLFSKPAAVQ